VAGRRLGVERICSVLQMAPSTYYAANSRPASARRIRDAEIAPRLLEIWESNYSVYGVRKLWKAARRSGGRYSVMTRWLPRSSTGPFTTAGWSVSKVARTGSRTRR